MIDKRHQRGDEGASLILVLVFIAAFALIVPALLNQSSQNVRSVAITRDVADASFDAEAAVDTAINNLRNGTFSNAPGQPCFHDPADLTGTNDSSAFVVPATSTNTEREVLVTCKASDSTGYATSITVPINNQNRPGQALLTLSQSTTGITHDKNNLLRIQGGVFSNSGVTVSNSNAELLVGNAPLIARGNCLGTITAAPRTCNYGNTVNAKGDDPNYVLPGTTPAVATAPNCSGATGIAISPGTYTDVAALEKLTNNCKALVQFMPGDYYFDFSGGDQVWDVTDGYVIGGSIPSGARSWTLAGYPGSVPPVPGACVSPTESTTNGGVQFIFGGSSRIVVSGGGKMELCGPYSATRPPIAVFGANAGAGSSDVTKTVLTKRVHPSGKQDFLNQQNLQLSEVPPKTSDGLIIGKNDQQRSGFFTTEMPFADPIPSGAVLTKATLKIRHLSEAGPAQEDNKAVITHTAGPITALEVAVEPVLRVSGNGPIVTASQPTINALMHEDELDITSELRPHFDSRGFGGLTTKYTASVATGTAATARVDSVVLELRYSTPGFKSTKNACGGAPCTVVEANGSQPTTQLYIQGTTYTPFSRLDVTLNNVSAQVFRFGLISDSVRVALTGSSSFAEAVISVPDETPGTGTGTYQPPLVTLQAYVCSTGSCTAPPASTGQGYVPAAGSGWVRELSGQVVLKDTAYPPLTGGQRPVDVVSWYHPTS